MPGAGTPPTATESLPATESLVELHQSIFGDSGRHPIPTRNARAVSHITFGLVARVFGAVEQVKEANDARLKELKHPVVNREKSAAYLLYDLVRMEFPAMPLPAVKAGKRLREQLNATERAIKSATDARCGGQAGCADGRCGPEVEAPGGHR